MGNKFPIHLTHARTANGVPATKKIIRRAGRLVKKSYNKGAWSFFYRRFASDDLEHLRWQLLPLIADPTSMLLHGAPRASLDLTKPHRRWSSRKHLAAGTATLIAADTNIFVLDCDGYRCQPGMGRGDMLEAAAKYVRRRLPPALAGCAMLVVASSSTGFKVDDELVNFRAFILLDKYYPLADLYRWARGARAAGFMMIDPRVMLPGQPIYIARPILVGVADPVPEKLHAFILDGRQCDGIDVDEYQPELRRHEAAIREYVAMGEQQGWRAVLDATLGVDPYGYFDSLTLALGIAARGSDTIDDIADYCVELVGQRADPDRIESYDRDWVAEAVENFRTSDNDAQQRAAEIYARLLKNPTKFSTGEYA